MKIRILGNSVRFRLTRSEVDTLCTKGYIEDRTHFDSQVFTYAVKMEAHAKKLSAQFKDNTIILNLPLSLGENWHRNEQVGFNGHMEIDRKNALSLLLEKDFICLDERLEDQSDNYPNPKATL
ncbi:hypothetical protein [uncultured Eudoraea sp.]|uniref:DUF7009 family protein n=1 Tax=uncultured Eudoraea sp. TaxID=1035614 RepID=UPI002601A90D|nr:hypothetical protein [uncultured Eudoraea sp.]